MGLFRRVGHEDDPDREGICVGFLDTDEYPAALQMFDRCYAGAELLLKEGQEMAFYLVRHCAELGLKLAAYGFTNWPDEHNLGVLLNAVPVEHEVRGQSGDARRFRSVLQEIARADRSGQAGRYPTLTTGAPAFEGLCHFPTDDLALFFLDT